MNDAVLWAISFFKDLAYPSLITLFSIQAFDPDLFSQLGVDQSNHPHGGPASFYLPSTSSQPGLSPVSQRDSRTNEEPDMSYGEYSGIVYSQNGILLHYLVILTFLLRRTPREI
jgi:hypothetical protein